MQEDFLPNLELSPQGAFPSTRYQGSKQKFIDWIWLCIKDFEFESCLDAFGGTGCFAYKAKQCGKRVTYNDILPFNHLIGKALIENQGVKLSPADVDGVLDLSVAKKAPTFIQDTFHDVYYTDEENRWLDCVTYNIRNMEDAHKQAMAYFSLFQSCIIKRPYNLFHRKNLYARTREVERSFGNKTTWDTPFEVHFRKFVKEANLASFDSGVNCRAVCGDALAVPGKYDLVYIDPPYVGEHGKNVDYAGFYHFLDGMVDYDRWPERIDYATPHRRLRKEDSPWCDRTRIAGEFEKVFDRFSPSILVVSYRSDGIPSVDELSGMLRRRYAKLSTYESWNIKYALSKSSSQEVLLLARN